MAEKIASRFNISTVYSRKLYRKFKSNPKSIFEIKKHNRKKKYSLEEIKARIRAVPVIKRSTLRQLANETKIPTTTLHRLLKKNILKRCNARLKPKLLEQHQINRLRFILSDINLEGDKPHFVNLDDVVHVDEKWFFIKKVRNKFYLIDEEDAPHCTAKNKNFIEKV